MMRRAATGPAAGVCAPFRMSGTSATAPAAASPERNSRRPVCMLRRTFHNSGEDPNAVHTHVHGDHGGVGLDRRHARDRVSADVHRHGTRSVSYTHLTLPTS